MKKVNFGRTGLQVSAIVAGCMRLDRLDVTEAANYIENAVAHDVNFFDHADIYGRGACEELFGVEVQKVNTMNVRGQKRRYGRYEGYKASWKKAIVTLTEDSKTIEFFEGMV